MSNYTPIVDYAAKDALLTGNPSKKILGTEISAELDAIETAVASKEDTANKGQTSGYCGLDASALVPDAQIPSNIPRKDAASNAFTGNVSVSGTLQMGGSTVWTAANDGSASGLDADLLDGQQGSYYQPISTLLSAILAIDGVGSGIDADLLDGQNGAYYLAATSYTAADVLTKLLTVDGAGSSIDADLLDGAQGSLYAKYADSTANFTGTLQYGGIEVGYRVVPRLSGVGGTAATTWRGKAYASTGGVTVPASTFAAGDAFMIYNNTASNMTITRGSGLTMYVAGVDSATYTLGTHDTCWIWFDTATACIVK